MINLNNAYVTFNKNTANQFNAIDGLNLNIKKGEFVVVIGGNGAGKSTLMNVIGGSIQLDSGSITISDKNVTKLSAVERAPMIARVFQDPMIGTFSNLTISENYVIFSARNRAKKLNFYNSSIYEFKEQLAKLDVGLENRLNQPIGLLSGGQRQLLSLVMSLSAPADILLLDEHTAALDPKMAEIVMNLTDELVKKHEITTLMITHNMQHAAKFGNRIIVLNHGKCIDDIDCHKKNNIDPTELWKETL
jgi:putative ABC transport system ATP-binding protein